MKNGSFILQKNASRAFWPARYIRPSPSLPPRNVTQVIWLAVTLHHKPCIWKMVKNDFQPECAVFSQGADTDLSLSTCPSLGSSPVPMADVPVNQGPMV